MSYCGDIRLGDTHDFKFTTRQISGAPFTLAGSPVISAYVGNSTTQITAGITLSVDFDSVTGLNNIRVVATGGNGYATGTDIDLVITTGTVNSVSVVGEVVASFSIENRSAVMPTTIGRTLDADASGRVIMVSTASGAITAGSFAAGAVDAAAIAANAIGSSEIATDAIGAAQIAANAIGASEIATGAITNAKFAAGAIDAAAIADAAIDAATFAAGAIDSSAIAANAIGASQIATDAIGSAEVAAGAVTKIQAGLSVLTAAQVKTQMTDALAVDTYAEPTGAPPATDTIVNKIGRQHQVLRNKLTVSATAKTMFDDGASSLWAKALADDGVTYTESEGA